MKTLLGPGIDMTIFAPAALSGTVHVEISAEKDAVDANFLPLNDGSGTLVTVAPGKVSLIPTMAFKDFRLVSASAEGADRVFTLYQQEWTT
jgi:hypothetical protein